MNLLYNNKDSSQKTNYTYCKWFSKENPIFRRISLLKIIQNCESSSLVQIQINHARCKQLYLPSQQFYHFVEHAFRRGGGGGGETSVQYEIERAACTPSVHIVYA